MTKEKYTHPLRKASAIYGSQAALARALGVTKGALNQWLRSGREVPIHHCAAIERLCDGLVTRKDLRPNDWAEVWPELSNAKSQHRQRQSRAKRSKQDAHV